MPGTSTKLRVGDAAPDFALMDSITGKMLSLGLLLGGHHAALIAFHRGMW
jgi:peroxiredoxin